MKNLLALLSLFLFIQLNGQNITVEIDRDSILQDNQFSVSIVLEDIDGDFIQPDFDGLYQIGMMTSMESQYINGVSTQKRTYTYNLYADEIGSYFIPPVSVETDSGIIETEPIEIIVLPNPDGIRQKVGKMRSFDSRIDESEFQHKSEDLETKKSTKRVLKKI